MKRLPKSKKGIGCPIPFKIDLKMRLAILCFLLPFLGMHAKPSFAQKTISLNVNEVSVFSLLGEIENRTDYHFIYKVKDVDLTRNLNLKVEEEGIPEVLNKIFHKTDVEYRVIDNYIFLNKRKGFSFRAPAVLFKEEQQQMEITGTVTDEDGVPLPGVNITVEGTSIGTSTDFDGDYSIQASQGQKLVFSFVGFKEHVEQIGAPSIINVQMEASSNALDEVVVTALGIKREQKAVAFSVSETSGDEFTKSRETNVANALTGKVAGVNATGLATGAGGSSRVIIRGNGSLSGNNQPLYVINGMPIDNSIPGGGTSTDGQGINADRGDGIGGINPDDIETISVLKGGAAAALYGSRAANGVILITTKSGKAQKGIGVEYSGNFVFETPSMFPKYQYEYGAGSHGRKPKNQDEAIEWGRLSFGEPMDGTPVVQFDGVERPYSPVNVKDNIKHFYRTGTNFVNTVALTGGSENINFRMSLSNMDNHSVVPNSTFNRKTTNINVHAKLSDKLTVEGMAQYNLEKARNRPGTGYADYNAGWATHLVSNTVDIRNMAPGYYEDGRELLWNPVNVANNPYWVVNKYENDDKKNRFIGQVNMTYDLLDNLSIRGTISEDFYAYEYEAITPSYTAFRPRGSYESLRSTVSERNLLLSLDYNVKLFENLTVDAMVGVNQQRHTNNSTSINGAEFVIPEYYSYTNLNTLTTTPSLKRTGVNSVFGSADFGFKDMLFLSLTGRQDWFSTLSPDSNYIFYPSIGGSFLLSEAVDLPEAFNYFKLRSSWAQVGGGAPEPYLINKSYGSVQGGHNGRPVQEISSDLVTNPNLRPYTSTTYEFGLDSRLFNSRLGIDLTFYNRETTNDIVQSDVSNASGYSQALLNVGKINNKGVELLLTGSPIETDNFTWNVSYNMAYNKSEIKQLTEGLNTIQIGSGIGGGSIQNRVGRPYGTIWGYKMARNDKGEKIFDPNSGYELRSEVQELGQGVPPLTMGLTNEFHYGDFSLSILLDGKFGNSVYSNLAQYAHRFGLTKESLPGRESGLLLSGVDLDGNPYERLVSVDELPTYYDNQKEYTDLFVYDASFVKLREVALTYSLPKRLLDFANIQAASVSLVGRNLAILLKHTDLFDPESSYTSGNAQGLEAFGVPRTRNIGIDVNIKF